MTTLGMAYFSTFTDRRQLTVYGLSWSACLTYGPEGEEEQVGPIDVDDYPGWYTPDWDRALIRAERLLAAWETTKDAHRKEYDTDKVLPFVELIRACHAHPDRANCQVNISD